ncbi:hypothetical protein [Singulisphaera sp. PoT]|uniref:hypothetical protein n=1 Tax=Singulisphaera sp. PoT TaxID=3411797 RepID=UPI003BF566CE
MAGLFDQTSLAINEGDTVLNWTPAAGQVGGTTKAGQAQVGAANPIVSQGGVVDNTWHQVAFVVTGETQALYLDGLLQGEISPSVGSSYSFTPTLAGGITASGPSGFAVGGATMPEPTSDAYPEINYPQGFIGTVDEVAAWTNALTQVEVQRAMTAPISGDVTLGTDLAAYFNFDQAPSDDAWPNQAPGRSGVAQGPTIGTPLVPVATTIPTDPFLDAIRLPGARDWGIEVMIPLSSPTVTAAANETASYKFGLDAGDQLGISVPDSFKGKLSIQVVDDLGSVSSQEITPGNSTFVQASRDGTYNVRLTWAPENAGDAEVNFSLLPGPLN